MYLPGYGLLALSASLPLAIAGAFFAGTGQSSAVVLVNSAAQEQVPDSVLGRVLGVISLTHRGADATPAARPSALRVRAGARGLRCRGARGAACRPDRSCGRNSGHSSSSSLS